MNAKSTLINYSVRFLFFNLLLLCSCMPVMGQIVDYNWGIRMGGISNDQGRAIAAAPSGNKYVTGTFFGTVDFNPDTAATAVDTLSSATGLGTPGYIAKYDNDGALVWAKAISGTASNANVNGTSVALDAAENMYVTGYFTGTNDFDPGLGVVDLTSAGVSSTDIYIAKYDANGNYVWAGRMGSIGPDQGIGIVIDDTGNIIVTGTFQGTTDFDMGVGEAYRTATGGGDIFMAKYTSAGNLVWVKTMGGPIAIPQASSGQSLTLDTNNNIYLSGFFYRTVDFDPGTGIADMTANPSGSGYIAKYDASGNYLWAGKIGNGGAASTIRWQAGRIYVMGGFLMTADFNPDVVDSNGLVSKGGQEVFLASYSSEGEYIWAQSIGGTGADQSGGLQVHKSGYIYVTGSFTGTVDFDPGPDSAKLVSAGSLDVFIAAYDTLGNYSWARRIGGNSSDNGNGISVDETRRVHITGTFGTTVDLDPGLDSARFTTNGGLDAFILQLSTTCFVNTTAEGGGCNSFTYNGQTYTSSGSYTQTYPLPGGCDSVITVKVIINDEDTSFAVTACKDYTWNGQTYSATGVYNQIFPSAIGCDSTVTLHLTINPIPDATVTASGKVLTSGRGDSYQWINCNDNTPVSNATGQSYTANTNGSYAVIVTVNGCSDTSDCVTVGPSSVEQLDNQNTITCYPNPTENKLNIDTKMTLVNADIRLVNVLGQYVLDQRNQNGTRFTLDLSSCAPGIYFCEIVEKGSMKRIKIIRK